MTTQQELEQRVMELEAELNQAMMFKTMADHSLEGILMADIEARFTYANQTAHTIYKYDYDQQEMIGMTGFDCWFEEDLPFLNETVLPQALAGGWHGEIRQKCKDGSPFYASVVVFLLGESTFIISVRDITERKQVEAERERLQQEIIDAQRHTLQELSTPVIPIMDRIIIMPLIGSIDTMRARDITRSLLAGITQHRAKIVIVDVTGVSIMDTGIVNHLNKTIQAARLKGARTIVTGISDSVAEAIVDLGIDWSEITTLSDLQTGLLMALSDLGVKLS